jgi:hypothetical protein
MFDWLVLVISIILMWTGVSELIAILRTERS